MKNNIIARYRTLNQIVTPYRVTRKGEGCKDCVQNCSSSGKNESATSCSFFVVKPKQVFIFR